MTLPVSYQSPSAARLRIILSVQASAILAGSIKVKYALATTEHDWQDIRSSVAS